MLEKGKQREEEKELEMDKREDTEKGTPIFLYLAAEVPCRITAINKKGEHGAVTNPGDICEGKPTCS